MLTVKHTFKLFDVINKHFQNEEDSRSFVSELQDIMDNKVDLKMNDFTTRKDLAETRYLLKADIAEFKVEVAETISSVRKEMAEMGAALRQEMAELRVEVNDKIEKLRFDCNKLQAEININMVNSALVLEKTQKEQLKWIIGAMFTIVSLGVAVIKLL